MAEELKLWRIEGGDRLREISRTRLDLEARLEGWLKEDISILDPGLLVIGRQVETDFGGYIDLLCLDRSGDLVVVELKRDKTPREITAQALDYGSWVKDLSHEQVTEIAEKHLAPGTLERAFKQRFGNELPESLNEAHHLLIVAAEVDARSERIIRYLSETYGVYINAATFQYFKDQTGSEHLARIFLLEPKQVEIDSEGQGRSKRRRNLTCEELLSIADAAGVIALYRSAVEGLERLLAKHTTRSSIGFAGNFDGGRNNIVSLIPRDSSAAEGLRFQVYINRLRAFFNLSEDAALKLLPASHEPWEYVEGGGPSYEGFQGFFADLEEIDRFVTGLVKATQAGSSARKPADQP